MLTIVGITITTEGKRRAIFDPRMREITNILECLVTMADGTTVVKDGEVEFQQSPSALGFFTNGTATLTVPLDADGRAKAPFISAGEPVTGKIEATGKNLKDPNDHTKALPDSNTTNITVRVLLERVALGKSKTMTEPSCFKVYVPTKAGGRLKAATTAGAIKWMKYPDGGVYTNDTETGVGKHGWYIFEVEGANNYTVSTTFIQEAATETRPWNYYWWSAKGDYIREKPRDINGNPQGNGKADTAAKQGANRKPKDRQIVPLGGQVAPGGDIVTCGPDGTLETDPVPDDELRTQINLFDVKGDYRPLEKYDRNHNLKGAARDEQAGVGDALDLAGTNREWGGSCAGAMIASIFLKQPKPSKASQYNTDELEGLWAMLGDNAHNLVSEGVNLIPAGPPKAGADATDRFAPRFHRVLERFLKVERKALASNLRAEPGGPPGTGGEEEVWNHAVYKYSAQFEEADGGDERVVKITNTVRANQDHRPPTNDENDRVCKYVYIISYMNDGDPDASNDAQKDWISVGNDAKWAPADLGRPVDPIWESQNPFVTEENVRANDNAN